jgi:hypothetical protein
LEILSRNAERNGQAVYSYRWIASIQKGGMASRFKTVIPFENALKWVKK